MLRLPVMVAAGGASATEASFVGVSRSILETGGWRGFYRGFGVTLIGYLPGGSVWWAAYLLGLDLALGHLAR